MPKLWWHRVQSLAPFNGLVNYWWDAFAGGPDAPHTAMLLSMITIAERPLPERQAWKALFDHYVFRPHGHPLAHLPENQHGMLGPLKAELRPHPCPRDAADAGIRMSENPSSLFLFEAIGAAPLLSGSAL